MSESKDRIKEYVNMLERQNLILIETVNLMGKWIRENPGADLDSYINEGMIQCLVGGNQDPLGRAYVMHFIGKAESNLKKRGEI